VKLLVGWDELVEFVLVEAPCFAEDALYAVAANGEAELLFGYGEAHPCRGNLAEAWYRAVDEPDRKNRKRFPGMEKRINILLSLEPLVCLEGITNGKKDLEVLI